ncbi:MAG: competence/damage-inducible protein A [Gemmatimonadaceae bacterium]|nr:competence/damage-inducible protein A [Gemmatimonadaceae bacterium]
MQIEVVTIGDELLLGFTIDTNGAWLARELAQHGITVLRRTSVGDGADEIAAAVGEALERTGAVITTGGLGPTSDDLTKPSIARLFGREMHVDKTVVESLHRRWKALGRTGDIPRSNLQQALIPDRAVVLPNAHGTAPGIWLEDTHGRWVAMLPGVPREMRGLFTDQLLPRMLRRLTDAPTVVRSLTTRTTGIAESALSDRILAIDGLDLEGLGLAYLPGWEGVDLRLTARGLSGDEADVRLARVAAVLRTAAGGHVYGAGTDDLAGAVLAALRTEGKRIAVAESCTGGMLGARLTAIPGASDVMLGGIIAYHNEVKVSALGVRRETLESHGAVSEETAREMATGVRVALGASVGVGITGIAGPDGGTPEKPVGTVCIAADVDGTVKSVCAIMIGDRHEVRQRSAQSALSLVRRMLLGTA